MKLTVTTYCINRGTNSQHFGLKTTEGEVLHFAPNHWKTEKGALRWALKNGLAIIPSKRKLLKNK